ncbi:CpaF family protein [Candidatus Woesearchaeota archaeon]|nr:CpaF family protein [Candidatus Woesearchaeota archaeon]
MERYSVAADGIKANVVIDTTKNRSYYLTIPELPLATTALMNSVKRELISKVNITFSEIIDPKEINNIKNKFVNNAEALLKSKLRSIDEETKSIIIGRLVQETLGLDLIEFLLNDKNVEEVVVNSASEPVRVYHKIFGWLETNVHVSNEAQIQNYSNIIARRVGRQISTLTPLLDAHLITGDRANAVLYPVSTKGNTLTIRKFSRDPWTVVDLINNKTGNSEIFSLIWLAMEYELNIIISGATASGKTSFLNSITPFIPPNQRIVSIEDTRELNIPNYLYWSPLIAREPNQEGKGKVSMLALLINSLRMRPDRIIVGEIRTKEQSRVLFEAMHTGHSVYSTLHANTAEETIQRLINPPINVPKNLLGAVNLNVVMFRDRRKGIRKVSQIAEFLVDYEKEKIKTNTIYEWKPRSDKIEVKDKPQRLFEEISRHTGMTDSEIKKDLNKKKMFLDTLVKNNIRDINSFGNAIRDYYLKGK